MSALRRLRRDDGGFTLIELNTTLAVLGIFLAAVALVLAGALKNSSQVEDQAVTQSEARAGIDVMAAEIRQAYHDSTSTFPSGATWLKTGFTGTTLTFFTPDRQSPFHVRMVSYRLNAGELQRAYVASTTTDAGPWMVGATPLQSATLGAWQTVVGSVVISGTSQSQFTYEDANGNVTATAANVATVRIKLVVSPRGSQGKTSTYVIDASHRV
jgi:prepilin-type N-terminal cleavage/methylation domain-containing protein